MVRRSSHFKILTIAYFLALVFSTQSGIAASTKKFDHFQTGFPLVGAHIQIDCEYCHQNAVFTGTPKSCQNCHNGVQIIGKPQGHIVTVEECDQCHNSSSFAAARFDHSSIDDNCTRCHNGITAVGKNIGHAQTTTDCSACHRTNSFSGAVGKWHDNVVGNCAICHISGGQASAKAKSNSHISSDNSCENCHNNFFSFKSVQRVDHGSVIGTCRGCHPNKVPTPPLPATHPATTSECDGCHNPISWSQVVGGAKPANHIPTGSLGCSECHTNSSNFSIVAPQSSHALNNSLTCGQCHVGGLLGPQVKSANHWASNNNCAECHLVNNKFRALLPSGHITTKAGDSCARCHVNQNTRRISGVHRGDHRKLNTETFMACANCHRTFASKPRNTVAAECRGAGCHDANGKAD